MPGIVDWTACQSKCHGLDRLGYTVHVEPRQLRLLAIHAATYNSTNSVIAI